MSINMRRVWAIILRHLYNFKHNLDRLTDAFYWPAIDIIIWGLTISALEKQGQADAVQITMLIFGVILWYVIWRSQIEITVNLLEEFWSENLVNLFSTPLTLSEWIVSLLSLGLIKLSMTMTFTAVIAFVLYSANLLDIGYILIPLIISLLLMGYAFGLFVAGLFLRFGTNIQTLAWAGGFALMPFSAVYFPLESLPQWMQVVSAFVPSSYVFEGMREVVVTGSISQGLLVKSFGLDIVYVSFSLWFFVYSFNKAKEQGIAHIK